MLQKVMLSIIQRCDSEPLPLELTQKSSDVVVITCVGQGTRITTRANRDLETILRKFHRTVNFILQFSKTTLI
jgi:hypothetical protein